MVKGKGRPAKILIVEDNQESIDLLVYFLKPAGYELFTAKDGLEALTEVKSENPDIVLLDAMLPKLNGYQVCRRLKRNSDTMHIPIIMITALKELKDKLKALEVGADDFVTKPFDSIELLARVKSLLRLKDYHDTLLKRNRQLVQQQKILERENLLKKELTNLIVHDMKNPLFVIQGNLQMMTMVRENENNFDEEKYAQRIERSSKGLHRMILNLLDISRLEQETLELQYSTIDLHQLLRETISYLKDNPQHVNKKCVLHLARILPHPQVDKALFERVLDNLFVFLFKNAPDYTEITVRSSINDEGVIELSVSHQGRPIPKDIHEKLFSKLAQPELRDAGFKLTRGLSLIFCKLALQAHNGDIRVDPAFRGGTRFIISIPATKSSEIQ
ncbi:MAG: hybrid sensor histidine kinase/response regulator [Calditrichia bacterium]